MPTIRCHSCRTAVSIAEPIPRDAECASCGLDLRCCLNCRHHDRAYNNECRETEADPVADKDRRNFCEFFTARGEPGTTGASPFGTARPATDRAAEARKALERLFEPKPKPKSDD